MPNQHPIHRRDALKLAALGLAGGLPAAAASGSQKSDASSATRPVDSHPEQSMGSWEEQPSLEVGVS